MEPVHLKEVRGKVILEGASDHSGVEVLVKEKEGKVLGVTDKDGNYKMKLTLSKFTLIFRKHGYNTKSIDVVIEGESTVVPDVVLSEWIPVKGRVIRTDGTPVSGIEVSILGFFKPFKTGEDGRYEIKGEILPGWKLVYAVTDGTEIHRDGLFKPNVRFYCVKVYVEEGKDVVAPDIIIPVHPAPYIKEWLFLGPLLKVDGTDFPYIAGIEKRSPKEGDKVGRLRWEVLASKNNKLNLNEIIQTPGFEELSFVAYCHVYVYSPMSMYAYIYTAHDDGMAVWVNGDIVYREENLKYEFFKTLEEQDVPITLKQGWNRVLVLVTQIGGEWWFEVQIHSGKREAIPELRYSIKPE